MQSHLLRAKSKIQSKRGKIKTLVLRLHLSRWTLSRNQNGKLEAHRAAIRRAARKRLIQHFLATLRRILFVGTVTNAVMPPANAETNKYICFAGFVDTKGSQAKIVKTRTAVSQKTICGQLLLAAHHRADPKTVPQDGPKLATIPGSN